MRSLISWEREAGADANATAVRRGRENRHTEINDELGNLETRDPFLPPDTDASCTLEVVPVHHHVNQQIQTDRDPGNRSETNELGVAESCSGAVVVAVEEGYDARIST